MLFGVVDALVDCERHLSVESPRSPVGRLDIVHIKPATRKVHMWFMVACAKLGLRRGTWPEIRVPPGRPRYVHRWDTVPSLARGTCTRKHPGRVVKSRSCVLSTQAQARPASLLVSWVYMHPITNLSPQKASPVWLRMRSRSSISYKHQILDQS